jgi:nitroreductase
MSFLDLIFSRRSIRRYQSKEIPEEALRQILEAGRQAPSSGNMQAIRFVVVKAADKKNELSTGRFAYFVKDAPVIVVGCASREYVLAEKWSAVDAVIAMENMVIAAWSIGVGSCWIGSFDEENVKMLLKIPAEWKVVALLTFGYPAEKPEPKTKKTFEELFGLEKF